jgi:hypothetical protein
MVVRHNRRKPVAAFSAALLMLASASALASMTNYTTPVNEPSNGVGVKYNPTTGNTTIVTNNQSIATPSAFQGYSVNNPSALADSAGGQAASSAANENQESRSMGASTGTAGEAPESGGAGGTGTAVAYGFIRCGENQTQESALDGFDISCTASGASSVQISLCDMDSGTSCGATPKVLQGAINNSQVTTNYQDWTPYTTVNANQSVTFASGLTGTLGNCVPYQLRTCVGSQCAGESYVNADGNTVTCNAANQDCAGLLLPNPNFPWPTGYSCAFSLSHSASFSTQNFYNLSNRGESNEESGLARGNSYISDVEGNGIADDKGTVVFQGTTKNSAQLASDILANSGMQACTENQIVNQMAAGSGFIVTCNGQNEVPVASGAQNNCSTGLECTHYELNSSVVQVSCDQGVSSSEAYQHRVMPVYSCLSPTTGSTCGQSNCSNIDNIPDEYRNTETWQCPIATYVPATTCPSGSTGCTPVPAHYNCTPGGSSNTVTYLSTCEGFATSAQQTGPAGATPGSPGEAQSGYYGQALTDYCEAYSPPPPATCPHCSAYDVNVQTGPILQYEDYAVCGHQGSRNWGCTVSEDTNQVPSSCPAPMSLSSNASPASGCSFGSLQTNSQGGNYAGACQPGQPNQQFASDVTAPAGCYQSSAPCTVTRDGACVHQWDFYACQGAIKPCPVN